ncbi:hypothetical protein [Enterococcus sp. AZ196]|uniref:hypothetical protein n=1 Tax=Enterococcus sp. AZ196 TaxID=2774659 RepID=UPI003D28288C
MKKKKPQKIHIRITYTIDPYDKWMLLDELLEERTELEIKQLFLEAEIKKQIKQDPEALPPIAKSLEMDLNNLAINELDMMIDRLEENEEDD